VGIEEPEACRGEFVAMGRTSRQRRGSGWGDSQVVVHYLAHTVDELPRELHATCSADDDWGRDRARSTSVGSLTDRGGERTLGRGLRGDAFHVILDNNEA
jgi:hypothetical protein